MLSLHGAYDLCPEMMTHDRGVCGSASLAIANGSWHVCCFDDVVSRTPTLISKYTGNY